MRKIISLGILFFIFLPLVLADSQIKLDGNSEICVNSNKNCFSYKDDIALNPSDNTTLKISFINSYDSWICFESWAYNLKITKLGGQSAYTGNTFSVINPQRYNPYFCLAPHEERVMNYLPINDFNNKNEDDKIGSWLLEPSYSFNAPSCFNEVSLSNNLCIGAYDIPIRGNDLSLKVEKEEIKPGFGGINWKKINLFWFIASSLSITIGLACVITGITKRRKDRSLIIVGIGLILLGLLISFITGITPVFT